MRRVLSAVIALLFIAVVSPTVPAQAEAQQYWVGAATRSIRPPGDAAVNVGGNGLGNGTVIPPAVVGPGSKRAPSSETIAARAIVISDGVQSIAMVNVETQGAFAAYQQGPYGLRDIANQVAAATNNGLPADNILISHDHTHSGPDLIGAWGFVPTEYLAFVAAQTRDAIIEAYNARRLATITAGSDDASDLIYNQNCSEALNQSATATFPNNVCTATQEKKDGLVRVLQARDLQGATIATLVSFAAHSTLGGGSGLHGDWPQFLADNMSAAYGGVGIALEGAVGRTQPCRPRCSFTDSRTPGYELADRKSAYITMLRYHVDKALLNAPAVIGPVSASKTFIRHDVTNPLLLSLLQTGETVGAPLARSRQAPWAVGNTVSTPVSAYRIGSLLINGAPGEAYPNIHFGVVEATNVPVQRHWTISLADDQLGYLIAPVEAYPAIAAQVAVNDNSIFNIDPGVGDHIMCTQIRLSGNVGFPAVRTEARCPAWDAFDTAAGAAGL